MLARRIQEGEKVKSEYSIKATQKVELLEVLTISFFEHTSLRYAKQLPPILCERSPSQDSIIHSSTNCLVPAGDED